MRKWRTRAERSRRLQPVFTRCPACHTVHPVNAALLTQGRGKYRCSKCNKVAFALLALFDDWPEAGQKPASIGDIPTLGQNLDLKKAEQSRLNPEADDQENGEPEDAPSAATGKPWLRLLWVSAAIVLVVIVLFQWAEFNGKPLLEQSLIQDALIQTGLKEPPPREVFRDTNLIHLVSRQLSSHPTRPDTLQLSATIVNRAPRSQPYPGLEVILLDAGGNTLASHEFAPEDYLAGGKRARPGMSPQAYLPLVLDLPDPGEQAVGFELDFK